MFLQVGCIPEPSPVDPQPAPDAGSTQPDAGSTQPDAGSTQPDAGSTDAHGNTLETAFPLEFGTLVQGELYTGDFDYFRFEAQAGHRYRARVGDGSARYYNIRVLNPALDWVCDSPPPMCTFQAAQSGVHYIYLAGGDGTYFLRLEDVTDDTHGDTRETATEVVVDEPFSGQFDGHYDYDYFRFEAVAGHRYVYNPLSGTSTSHSMWPLYIKPVTSGTQYIELFSLTPSGTYVVRVEDHGLDDYGDGYSEATRVALETDVPGAFQGRWDTDYFSFTAQAKHSYRIRIADGSSTGHEFRVMRPDPTPVSSSTTYGSSSSGSLMLTLPYDNTYYIEARAGDVGGTYVLHITDLGP
ncbi:hypothetical protein DAT35_21760 [Vitiosangium sp. GDMCC 1.1324]|nr:hypothetical protein DAT35_21760 [Vitiosangium sp. GDMCC 1.1324]